LPNLLRKQGLSGKPHEIIFQALIISRYSYALPAFGFLSCMHVAHFNAFFANLLNGVSLTEFFILKFSSDPQFRMFKRFEDNTEICLNQLLPELRHASYVLRWCGDNFHLPVVSKVLFEESHIVKCLYKFI
jgi:hypothetical protein